MAKYNVQVTALDGEVFDVSVEADSIAEARRKALVGQETGSKAGTPVLDTSQANKPRFRTRLPGESTNDYILARNAYEGRGSTASPSLSTLDINPDLFDEGSSSFSDQYKVAPDTILPAPFNPYVATGPGNDGSTVNINPDLELDSVMNVPEAVFRPAVAPPPPPPPPPAAGSDGFNNDPALQIEIDRLIAAGLSAEQARAFAEAEAQAKIDWLTQKNQELLDAQSLDNVEYVDPESKRINEAALAYGNPEQTEASRQRQLEGTSTFGSFLEQLDNAGLGDIRGIAGRFLKNQYQPLVNEYTTQSLMPLIMGEAAGEGSERGRYLDALRRTNTAGAYEGLENAEVQRLQDKEDISQFAPTFGSFLGSRVQGGAQASQLRQLEQLRNLAGMSINQDNPFASGVLNPSGDQEADLVFQLAEQGMAGRYSPLAQQAISRYAGSGAEAFADFARQSLSPVGARQFNPDTEPMNFAKFLGNRYGLF